MARGKVVRIARSGQFGFIQPDDGGEDVYFRVNWVRDVPPSGVTVGLHVEYETRETPRGLQTRWVRAVVGEVPSKTRPERREYRFLNPYNFVRPLAVRHPEAEPLLGSCKPPPHDRYLGNTGRLKCRLTVQTPTFISDSHAVEVKTVRENGKKKEHSIYRFFEYNDEPALPASSLRGMLRSVFEAVTNSCFSVFAGHKRLSYHLPPHEALKLIPARVIHENGKWYLDILNGTTPVVVGERPDGPQYAAWVMQYKPPLRPSRTHRQAPNTDYSGRNPIPLAGCKHGDMCQAVIEQMGHPLRNFQFWNVVQIAPVGASPLRPHKHGQRVVTGYLCITNQNIQNKHDERFFFCDPGPPTRISLPDRVRDRYRELIQDYQERHADDVASRRRRREEDPTVPPPDQPEGDDAAFSRFILNEEEVDLKHGALVYAMLGRTGRTGRVEFVVPVSVPRVGYEQTVGDRLDPGVPPEESGLHKCRSYDQLCPACRVFGWVYGTGDPEEPELDTGERAAYAGRVRLTHGAKRHITGTSEATLAILSSPKPTTTRFYLRPTEGPPRDGLDDRQVDYSKAAGQQLRGRKVYRHQGDRLSEQEYTSPDRKQTDQNRTVRGVVQPGSTFEFDLEFENLADAELGALLWSLELDGWHHRLGLGKPLGFGSVTIQVIEMELVDLIGRYEEFSTGRVNALDRKDTYVRGFQDAMEARYGPDFYALDNIRDLRALLAESPDHPVHYPRSTSYPQPEGKNFEWFVWNKRKGGPRQALRLATEDDEGLLLVRKGGRTG